MATRYWVGGSGTWDASSTANWATTSGGAPGASAPVAADTVIFDAGSGSGTCTTANGSTCRNVTLNSSTLGLTLGANHTMAGTFTLTAGALALGPNTLTCAFFSSSNTNVRSISFETGNITVTGNSATVVEIGNATNFTRTGNPTFNLTYAGSTGTRAVTHGSTAGGTEANCVNYNITAGSDVFGIGSGSFVGSFNFTGFSGTFNFGTTGRTFFGDIILVPAMTIVGGTGVATFAATSGTKQITTAGKTLDLAMNFNGADGAFAFQDALTQGSTRAFTITNGTVKLKNGVTSTVGAFATSGTNQKFLESTLSGSQATLSQASGTVSVSNLTIKDINATGGATWNAFVTNGNVDAGNNTGWDFFTQLGKYIYTRRKNKRILL